jgi:hypothetical protein
MFGSSLLPVVCLIYIICVCLRIVVFNTYCVVFLFCLFSSCVTLPVSRSSQNGTHNVKTHNRSRIIWTIDLVWISLKTVQSKCSLFSPICAWHCDIFVTILWLAELRAQRFMTEWHWNVWNNITKYDLTLIWQVYHTLLTLYLA